MSHDAKKAEKDVSRRLSQTNRLVRFKNPPDSLLVYAVSLTSASRLAALPSVHQLGLG